LQHFVRQQPALGIIDLIIGQALSKAIFHMTIFAYAFLYMLPVILVLPIIAPVVILWRRPRIFLLLRPFNRGWPNRALKRISRRDISGQGHIYTLADADIRVPWAARLPLLLGQFSLFSFHQRQIRTGLKVNSLDRVLSITWLRNLNWCLSYSKIFPISSSDDVWQSCVVRLATRADVILVDLSNLRPSVVWELELCASFGKEPRILYFVAAEKHDLALSQLATIIRGTQDPTRVFAYNSRGLTDRQRLREKLADLCSEPAVTDATVQDRPTVGKLSAISTALFCILFGS
jgi:hypothetical protein